MTKDSIEAKVRELDEQIYLFEKKQVTAGVGTVDYNHKYYLAVKENLKLWFRETLIQISQESAKETVNKMISESWKCRTLLKTEGWEDNPIISHADLRSIGYELINKNNEVKNV